MDWIDPTFGVIGLRRRFLHASAIVLAMFALLTLCGCERAPYPVAPVRGKVTIDGRPYARGKVMFAPIARGENLDPGRPAFGRLQPDGSFVLSTFEESDGAIVGEHWATIINPTDGESPATGANIPKFGRVAVPRKIEILVGQENEVEIALTSQDVARFGQQAD